MCKKNAFPMDGLDQGAEMGTWRTAVARADQGGRRGPLLMSSHCIGRGCCIFSLTITSWSWATEGTKEGLHGLFGVCCLWSYLAGGAILSRTGRSVCIYAVQDDFADCVLVMRDVCPLHPHPVDLCVCEVLAIVKSCMTLKNEASRRPFKAVRTSSFQPMTF